MISSGLAFQMNGCGFSALYSRVKRLMAAVKIDNGMEDAVLEPAPGEFGEEALDGV